MAASRACGRSRAAAMQGHVSGVQEVNCRKAAREAPLGGAAGNE